jgi:hypothetical protein
MLFVLALFALFAAGALILCTAGANVLRTTATTAQHDYDTRTGDLYLAEKIRQFDVAGATRIDTVAGGDALVFSQQVAGSTYETWVYVYNGELSEELIPAGSSVDLQQGQAIMPMQSMTVAQTGSDPLVHITLVNEDGSVQQLSISQRSAPATALGGDAQ